MFTTCSHRDQPGPKMTPWGSSMVQSGVRYYEKVPIDDLVPRPDVSKKKMGAENWAAQGCSTSVCSYNNRNRWLVGAVLGYLGRHFCI